MPYSPLTAQAVIRLAEDSSATFDNTPETTSHWLLYGVKRSVSVVCYMAATLPCTVLKNGLWDYVIYPVVDEIGYRIGAISRSEQALVTERDRVWGQYDDVTEHYKKHMAGLRTALAEKKQALQQNYRKQYQADKRNFAAALEQEQHKLNGGNEQWVRDNYARSCALRDSYYEACHGNAEWDYKRARDTALATFGARQTALEQRLTLLEQRIQGMKQDFVARLRVLDGAAELEPSQLTTQARQLARHKQAYGRLDHQYTELKAEAGNTRELLDQALDSMAAKHVHELETSNLALQKQLCELGERLTKVELEKKAAQCLPAEQQKEVVQLLCQEEDVLEKELNQLLEQSVLSDVFAQAKAGEPLNDYQIGAAKNRLRSLISSCKQYRLHRAVLGQLMSPSEKEVVLQQKLQKAEREHNEFIEKLKETTTEIQRLTAHVKTLSREKSELMAQKQRIEQPVAKTSEQNKALAEMELELNQVRAQKDLIMTEKEALCRNMRSVLDAAVKGKTGVSTLKKVALILKMLFSNSEGGDQLTELNSNMDAVLSTYEAQHQAAAQ